MKHSLNNGRHIHTENKGWGIILPLVLFIVCQLSACSENSSTDTFARDSQGEIQRITVEDIPATHEFSDLIDSVQYISLQAIKDNVFIGNIDKAMISGDRLYLLDTKTARGLFCFDLQGNHLFSINQRGNGPGEFVNISDFDIDEEKGQIFIYDEGNGRMNLFSIDGKYVGSGPKLSTLGVLPDCFVLFGDKVVSYNKNNCNDNGCNSIQISDLNDQLVGQGVDNQHLNNFNVDFGTPIVRHNNLVAFTQLLNDTIYYLNEDLQIQTPYVVDFGKYKMSQKERKELVNYPKEVMSFFTQSNKTPGMVFINLNDNFILAEIFQNSSLVTLLIERATNEYLVFEKYKFDDKSHLPISNIVGSYEDKFIYFNNNENTVAFKNAKSALDPNQYQGALNSINDETSGVIAIAQFHSLKK